MKRSGPIRRNKRLGRSGRIDRDPESIREWERRSRRNNQLEPRGERYRRLVAGGKRESDLWAAVKKMPCLICGARPADPHHVKPTSKGYHDRLEDGTGNLVPLCRRAHDEYHDHPATFEEEHDIDLAAEAARIGRAT